MIKRIGERKSMIYFHVEKSSDKKNDFYVFNTDFIDVFE